MLYMPIRKPLITTSTFNKKLEKLEKFHLYSWNIFYEDIKDFFKDERTSRFRKHEIKHWISQVKIFLISLWYDLRSFYYEEAKVSNDEIEYISFNI